MNNNYFYQLDCYKNQRVLYSNNRLKEVIIKGRRIQKNNRSDVIRMGFSLVNTTRKYFFTMIEQQSKNVLEGVDALVNMLEHYNEIEKKREEQDIETKETNGS